MTERGGSDTASEPSGKAASRPAATRVGAAPAGGKGRAPEKGEAGLATGPAASQGSSQAPRPGAGPAQVPGPGQDAGQAPGLTERINAAYASSGPVVADDASAKPTPAQRSTQVRMAGESGPGRGGEATPARPPSPAPRRVRKARLRLTHIDPWSVMKTAFLLAVALGIVTVVAVSVVWWVLDAAGVWVSINQAVGDVVGESGSGFRIEDYLGLNRVLGFTMLVAVVDVVLITVIATLGAFLYNLAAALLGGLEVVLAEEDH